MNWIVLSIVIYLLSAYGVYKHIQIEHSKGGKLEKEPIASCDIFVVFFPGLNTLGVIIGWIFFYPKKIHINCNKFFKLKK